MQYNVGKRERRRPNPFGKVNVATTNQIKAIENVSPAYAKHALLLDTLVMAFAREKFGGVEILDLPMCKKCERPGMWDLNSTCFCEKCGNTGQTKTLREYLREDVKEFGFTEEQLLEVERCVGSTFPEWDIELESGDTE